METISISKLKAHLSAEIKRVRKGAILTIIDHKHPVAKLVPLKEEDSLFSRRAKDKYIYQPLSPLTKQDVLKDITEERDDRW